MMWKEVNGSLYDTFLVLSADQWLAKHTVVSNEDFLREPHRNKLNVLLSSTAILIISQGNWRSSNKVKNKTKK